MSGESITQDSDRWDHNIRAANTYDELVDYLSRHGFSEVSSSMKRQRDDVRRASEEAGLDPDSAEHNALERLREWVLRYFSDPGSRSDDSPSGVREPKRRSPGGRRSAAEVPEPDDEGQSVDAFGSMD